jgi:hypothetical protein
MRCALATLVALTTVHSLTPGAQSGSGPLRVGETAVTKAIELRVEGVETAPAIGGRQARPGYEFVIVDTLWKNVIPLTPVNRKEASSPTGGLTGFGTGRRPAPAPGDVTMEPTKYVVPSLKRHFWLFTDGRYADPVHPEAQNDTPGHLPDGFTLAKLDDTLRGKVVFEGPASASHRAFQFFDSQHGHVLVTLAGPPSAAPPPAIGAAKSNDLLQLALAEAGFRPAGGSPPPGLREYVVGLRGTSRSPKDIVEIRFQQYVFLINDQGCLAQPLKNPDGLARAFGSVGSFPPTSPNEGQLAFHVPEGSRSLKLLVRPSTGGPIDLPAGADFAPAWPAPRHTFADGSTMKVHLLPAPARPPTLPPPGDGRRHVLLDVAVENLSKTRGIEFQPVQLRLATPAGGFVDPSPLSVEVPCRLDGDGVVPAGGARRFLLVYEVETDGPLRVNFRGFELNEATADLP